MYKFKKKNKKTQTIKNTEEENKETIHLSTET